jgi:hypothetical protein
MNCDHLHTKIVTSRIQYGSFRWVAVEFCLDCGLKLENGGSYGN